jgi:hypothetical protein
MEDQLILTPPVAKEEMQVRSPMDLLSLALQKDAAIDVIERLAALQEKFMAKQSEQSFFRDLHAAQDEVPSIEPNKAVKTNAGKVMYRYASYEQLDKALRPIYIKYGMAIAFSGAEAPAGKVRVLCCVSHRDGHAERYQLDLAIDQGAAQLTKTDAELAAQSKAKRRILRNIFNIVDDMEDEGVGSADQGWLDEQLGKIARCETVEGLMAAFQTAATVALEEIKDIKAYNALKAAKNARKKELQ